MNNQFELIEGEQRTAILSSCGLYRYELRRIWSIDKPSPSLVVFIGLNPSTADAIKDDQTIRRCRNFAKRWRFDGMIMVNLFAFRASKPEEMKKQKDPIGSNNDLYLRKALAEAALVIGAWGNHGVFLHRGALIAKAYSGMQCLGITKQGQPKHPSRLAASTPRIPFTM
jgi:hypothetical protein